MGYESKFYAVRDYGFKSSLTKGYNACEVVAMLDMCKMGYAPAAIEFLNLFDAEAPIAIWMPGVDDDGNETMVYKHEDPYGDPISYISDKDEGIKAVERIINEDKDDYWRFKVLLDFMKMFKDYDNVLICHYGY